MTKQELQEILSIKLKLTNQNEILPNNYSDPCYSIISYSNFFTLTYQ